eukprot:3831033-Rhodomonas_salina.1
MAAAAALAAAQAAQAAATASSQQAIDYMREKLDSDRAEKEAQKPGELDANPLLVASPRWNLTCSSYARQKKNDWVYELDPGRRLAHVNYPPDQPAGLAPADLAAAQQRVDKKRKQQQENVHALLVSTCSKSYFNVCNKSNVNDPLCRTKLWGSILELCNPDEESLVQYYQSMMKRTINLFNGEWDNWIKEIEVVSTILENLKAPFPDQEFREHMYPAIEKVTSWATWVEVQR